MRSLDGKSRHRKRSARSTKLSCSGRGKQIRLGLGVTCRVYAETVTAALTRDPSFHIVGYALDSQALGDLVRQKAPQVLLLDMAFPDAHAFLNRIRAWSRTCRILLLCPTDYHPDILIKLLRAGAYGCFKPDWDLALLRKALRAVARGEPWLDNSTMTQLLREMTSSPTLSELTDRECQILEHLRQGHRNKEIANCLAISEQTVKTHLRHLFRKLGISSRRQLQTLIAPLAETRR